MWWPFVAIRSEVCSVCFPFTTVCLRWHFGIIRMCRTFGGNAVLPFASFYFSSRHIVEKAQAPLTLPLAALVFSSLSLLPHALLFTQPVNTLRSLANFRRTLTRLPCIYPVREWETGQGWGPPMPKGGKERRPGRSRPRGERLPNNRGWQLESWVWRASIYPWKTSACRGCH